MFNLPSSSSMAKIFIIFCSISFAAEIYATTMADSQYCISGQWTHSHEEDSGNIMTYRPADYKFPPSRGREGLEFKKNGDFIYFSIAPTDGNKKNQGKWHFLEDDLVKIELDNKNIESFSLMIISCKDGLLKVKRK